jgi:ABC-2 type transport system permease protein
MSLFSGVMARLRRGAQIGGAFLRIDLIDAANYPLAVLMRVLSAFVPIIIYVFVAQMVDDNGADVGHDYYTFVVIGMVAMSALGTSLNSFGTAMLKMVTQGQLEMFLMEPVRWRVLPFAMMPFPGLVAVITSLIMFLLSVPLGADYVVSAVPAAIVIMALGLVATLAIGILGASVKVLSKRSDPVLALYTIAASVLSGAFFPVDLLPPFLRTIAWLIPHTYVIQALRRVMMPAGESLPGPTSMQAIGALILFSLILYPFALWVFGRGLEYGRKIGALSGY